MCAADMLAWGTPVYRHGMTGTLKTVIERMNDEPTKRNRPDALGVVSTSTHPSTRPVRSGST